MQLRLKPERLAFFMPVLLLLSVFFLSACGGSSSGYSDASIKTGQTDPQLVAKITGVAQKGPFSIDSVVTLSQLTHLAQPTGKVAHTKITDASGKFSFQIPEDWRSPEPFIVLLNISGRFSSEINAQAANHPLSLNALVIPKSGNSNNVSTSINLLTQWIATRAQLLVKVQGLAVDEAVKQASGELSEVTGIAQSGQLDFSQNSKNQADNAQLLLLSGALLEVANKYGVTAQYIVNQISVDFAVDGKIDNNGRGWFTRIQEIVRLNPDKKTDAYASRLNQNNGLSAPGSKALPGTVKIAARPQAIAPEIIYAEPGATVILDGSGSHDSGNIINFTWFRIDQQTQFKVLPNDRFAASPTIVVPNQECELLFALIVTDEQKLTDTVVVKVIVRKPENQPPIAHDQTVVTDEDTPLDILLSGADPENDNLDFDAGSLPMLLEHGILEGKAPKVTFIPSENYFGEESFQFRVNDGSLSSENARVKIIINPVNDPPVADPQAVSTPEDTPVSIVLTGSDIEDDPLSFQIQTSVNHGVLDISALPTVVYTPNSGYNGSDSFSFIVNDGQVDSASAQVSITVLPVNGKPFANSQSIETYQETPIGILLTGSDQELDPLTYSLLTNPESGILTGNIPNLIYQPNSGFFGTDGFTFKVNDGELDSDAGQVQIIVIPVEVNNPPVAYPQSLKTEQNTPFDIVLSGNDSDYGDSLIFNINIPPQHGVLTGIPPNLTYSPQTDYSGTDFFYFSVFDGTDYSNVASVSIEVTGPENTAPVADAGEDQKVPLDEEVITVFLDGTDSSDPDDDEFTYLWETTASSSSISIIQPSSATPSFEVSALGEYEFKLTVTDIPGGLSHTDTVIVSVQAPPTADNLTVPIVSNTVVTLSGKDYDANQDPAFLVYEIDTPPLYGMLSATGVLPGNTVTYTPDSVPVADSFTYRVKDAQGWYSKPATVTLSVETLEAIPQTLYLSQNDLFFNGETYYYNIILEGKPAGKIKIHFVSGSEIENGLAFIPQFTNPATPPPDPVIYVDIFNSTTPANGQFQFYVEDIISGQTSSTATVTLEFLP